MQPIELPVPKFPPAKAWTDLQRYPDKDGTGEVNLLERLEETLTPICADDDVLIEYSISNRMNTLRRYRDKGTLKW